MNAIVPSNALLPEVGITQPTPTKVKDAAQQFESLLLAQMLKSARESASTIGGEDESESGSSTMLEIAEQQFAQMLAQKGGLGLARLVAAGLERGAKNQ